MARSWTVAYALRPFPEPPHERRKVATEAVLGILEQAEGQARGAAVLIRICDSADEMTFLDVCISPWGWALLVNDSTLFSDSYGTVGDDRLEQVEWFNQPRGEGFELSQRLFVKPDSARRAVSAYIATGKLWNGVKWTPDPPPAALVD